MPLWARLRRGARQRRRRPQERSRRLGAGRLGHRGAVPEAVRARSRRLGPLRHLRLEPAQPPRLAAGRGGPGDPRPLRGCSRPATHEPGERSIRLTLARPDLAAAGLEGVVAADALRAVAPDAQVAAPRRAALQRAPTRPAEQLDQLLLRRDVRRPGGRGRLRLGARRGATAMSASSPPPALAAGRRRADPLGRGAQHLRLRRALDQSARRRARSASTPWSGSRPRTASSAARADGGLVPDGGTWRRSDRLRAATRPRSPSASSARLICWRRPHQRRVSTAPAWSSRRSTPAARLPARRRPTGHAGPRGRAAASFARGDLVFWRGHIGMHAGRRAALIHANAHHMAVVDRAAAKRSIARDRGRPGRSPTVFAAALESTSRRSSPRRRRP